MPALAESPERFTRRLSLLKIKRDNLQICRCEQSVERPHPFGTMSRLEDHRGLNEAGH
jgi:hypothetical protein